MDISSSYLPLFVYCWYKTIISGVQSLHNTQNIQTFKHKLTLFKSANMFIDLKQILPYVVLWIFDTSFNVSFIFVVFWLVNTSNYKSKTNHDMWGNIYIYRKEYLQEKGC